MLACDSALQGLVHFGLFGLWKVVRRGLIPTACMYSTTDLRPPDLHFLFVLDTTNKHLFLKSSLIGFSLFCS